MLSSLALRTVFLGWGRKGSCCSHFGKSNRLQKLWKCPGWNVDLFKRPSKETQHNLNGTRPSETPAVTTVITFQRCDTHNYLESLQKCDLLFFLFLNSQFQYSARAGMYHFWQAGFRESTTANQKMRFHKAVKFSSLKLGRIWIIYVRRLTSEWLRQDVLPAHHNTDEHETTIRKLEDLKGR